MLPAADRIYADLQTQAANEAWNAGAAQLKQLLRELADEITEENINALESMQEAGVNSPDFNQAMGGA
jgi:hypothetical protein